MKSLHIQVYLPGFLFPCPFSLTTLVTTSILPVRARKFQKEKAINNDNWKDRAEIHSYTERAGDKESWTGFERIPHWRSSWAVFKNCYCEVLPHTSEVDIIDFHRKRWRTSHLLSSFCTRLCALKKMIFALCSISLIKMSSYNITLGKNGPNLILLNINNVI